jgi:release factor glutamine methyltransferase
MATPSRALVASLRAAGCVFAEEEAVLLEAAAGSAAELASLLARRVAGEPLEHVVGWAEFAGLRIAVGPGVFVPRPRTEVLVDEAAALARPGSVVLDLCCGSGALGAALATRVEGLRLYAADLDPAAVRCAWRNLAAFATTAISTQVLESDLYAALPAALRGRVDVLLCNVPYVPTEAIALMPAEAREHEPRLSLDGGADGLDVLRRVAAEAPAWLASGGSILVETSDDQVAVAIDELAANGLHPRVVTAEDATAVVATKPLRTGQPVR